MPAPGCAVPSLDRERPPESGGQFSCGVGCHGCHAFAAPLQEIGDSSERSAYLDRACAGDPALRAQVEQLLKAHQEPGRFMERPAPVLVATVDEQPLTERSGTVIGPYKLLEQIGEGGFGVVFM